MAPGGYLLEDRTVRCVEGYGLLVDPFGRVLALPPTDPDGSSQGGTALGCDISSSQQEVLWPLGSSRPFLRNKAISRRSFSGNTREVHVCRHGRRGIVLGTSGGLACAGALGSPC